MSETEHHGVPREGSYHLVMDDGWIHLARLARASSLNLDTLEDASEEALRSFTLEVLRELAARGLSEGGETIGCHARPRARGN